jgi:HK97 family phage portal protein
MGLLERVNAAARTGNGRAERAMWGISSPVDLVPPRPFLRPGQPVVTTDTAMRHSAVWAALGVRADLISTMPVGVYRMVGGVEVQNSFTPQVLINPGGEHVGIAEWMYSSQVDLDRAGNSFGLITARDGNGMPTRIELQPVTGCSVIVKDGQLDGYRIHGKVFAPDQVWHEKQYTIGGLHVGLSPIAYAAWSIGEYLSVQQFAIDWFAGGAIPRSRLKNTARKLVGDEAAVVKESWRASIAAGEPFVHGSDWEYDMIQAQEASADWIEAKKFSITDIARFFRVPADMIDATPTGTTNNIRYANITQANLQFLTLHLQPAIVRREIALSNLLLKPKYVRLDTASLLRMDPTARATMVKTQIDSRVLAPSEARAIDGRPPFTQAQIDELDHFWPPKSTAPAAGDTGPASQGDGGGGGQPELPPGSDQPALPAGSK